MTAAAFTVAMPFEPDHPAFAGHFPGNPIIPGVQLVDRVKSLIEARHGLSLTGLHLAKFFEPAGPGDMLELDYQLAGDTVRFELRCGTRRIAAGKFAVVPSVHP